ncbi:hypothetical protein PTSG_04555 [Salpingoeca rosetta]|uniref:PPM-type phosphatase domain-containing protein n=1 Tax=Salpingoeca rosetta (strain ATCC 50818 / BSB-021) TaxID=946362 RepID=F2U7S1_SALR5|nr:uncharacterized protein PTSG_04555 [Salpingoeca rosetta]EGD72826.1 hypothetical protein PTSG_04555 [Salpingoeca rosetta]|eukprot:XP_004994649.1 hypothetical protein PTSG_04555 [Salpingoeca rosetta]
MGQFLDKPNTEKESHFNGISEGAHYGLSSMQGWRIHMEDAHTHVTNIPELPNTAFFAIFDGHGGKTVAQAGSAGIMKAILSSQPFKEAKTEQDKTNAKTLEAATKQGLLDLDDLIKQEHEELRQGHDRSGSTVVTCFITPTHFVFGNCGDSRVVLVSNNVVKFASSDHKPTNASEQERVKKAGGFVEMGRVCGNLAVSRALGDYEYKDRSDLPAKDQKISAAADMTVIERTDQDNFLVMACDGIWDVCTNDQIRVFVTFYLERGYSTIQIAEKLLDHCLEIGSRDNMSVLVITLKGSPKAKSQIPENESEEQHEKRIAEEKAALSEEFAKLPQAQQPAAPPTGVVGTAPANPANPPARRPSEDDE